MQRVKYYTTFLTEQTEFLTLDGVNYARKTTWKKEYINEKKIDYTSKIQWSVESKRMPGKYIPCATDYWKNKLESEFDKMILNSIKTT